MNLKWDIPVVEAVGTLVGSALLCSRRGRSASRRAFTAEVSDGWAHGVPIRAVPTWTLAQQIGCKGRQPPDWYQPEADRPTAERWLQDRLDGTFLVRPKHPALGLFCVSAVHCGRPTHHLVHLPAERHGGGYATFNDMPCVGCTTLTDVVGYLHEPHPYWPLVLRGEILTGESDSASTDGGS